MHNDHHRHRQDHNRKRNRRKKMRRLNTQRLGSAVRIAPLFFGVENKNAEKVGRELFGDSCNITKFALFVKFVNLLETVI